MSVEPVKDDDQPGRFLSLAEAKARIDASRDFIMARVADGSLPAYRLGPPPRGKLRFRPEDVDATLTRVDPASLKSYRPKQDGEQ
ncbi:hypothetical protein FK529_08780 [Tsukamurella asaccharolytica]|uniref:Helix-turn-helix domain-containing protein n=1 Tax=Tsukamurella asaccharolytica TaxID=2592067 RepID=A0A5C5RCZ8_9ACTN|nr:hypothetical protein FK529_08780 [Tsukamurella asaccharolytica]